MLIKFFERLEVFWDDQVTTRVISNLLIMGFVLGLAVATASHFSLISYQFSFFVSLDIAFSLLLIFEVLGLIFILPRSVADSVGKQFEILSIILLRSAFKEFGKYQSALDLEQFTDPSVYYMFADAFGALLIFVIIGVYYRMQRHERITDTEQEQHRFIRFKQVLAMSMLVVFIALGVKDVTVLFTTGVYDPSIKTFYLFLIFADVSILLYSLRYTTRYTNIFRYSSFAFATVLIRMSLASGPLINVIIGVVAGLFVLGLSYTYNYFMSKNLGHEG